MDSVTIKRVETEEDMEAAVGIRFRVFVDEQSVPPEIELDEFDAVATHAIALVDGVAVGTGRAIIEGDSARIGRMAVDQAHRRGGVGGLILSFLEDEAREQGATEFVLHAQEYVKAFYAGHGYEEHGDTFMEAGIRHIEMRKGG
jgi:predicted GNAT family N-acyltransferase